MQSQRTVTLILGLLALLLGGWLLVGRIGGIIDSVAVPLPKCPLPKCPLPGLSLPAGSVLESETLQADGRYIALFYNDQLPPGKVVSTMQQRLAALDLQVDAGGTNIVERRISYVDKKGLLVMFHDAQMDSADHQYWELLIFPAER